MKTAEFPAVEQARKVVEKQAKFYMAMMSDENEPRAVVRSRRKSVAPRPVSKRKKSPVAEFAYAT